MANLSTMVIAAFLVLLPVCMGQVAKFGSCPEFTLQQNFDPTQYFSGIFYEQKRFWAIFELGSKCVNAEYSLNPDNTVKVNNSGVSIKTGERHSQVGEAYCEDEQKAACHVRFFPVAPYGDYNLLAADPNKFGLVYSCRQVIPKLFNLQYAWILTRDKQVSDIDMNRYLDVFKKNGIDISSFNDTPQDCSDN